MQLDEDEAQVDAVFRLLQDIGRCLFASTVGHAKQLGLTPGQAKVLLHLGHHGRVPVGEIAAALGVSMPAASELVDRLVDDGFARRDHDPTDRRRVIVEPTAPARRLATELRTRRRDQARRVLLALPTDARPGFVRGLGLLVEALDHAGSPRAVAEPPDACGDSARREGEAPAGTGTGTGAEPTTRPTTTAAKRRRTISE